MNNGHHWIVFTLRINGLFEQIKETVRVNPDKLVNKEN